MNSDLYQQLLKRPEWKQKRNKIVTRDKWKCDNCENKKIILNKRHGIVDLNSNISKYDLIIKEFPNFSSVSFSANDEILKLIDKYSIVYFDDSSNYIQAARSLLPIEYEEYVITYNKRLRDDFKKANHISLEDYVRNIGNNHSINNSFQSYTTDKPTFINTTNEFSNYNWKYVRGLNVHHKFYQEGKKPWDYLDVDLITYCEDCHNETHNKTIIPIYDKSGKRIVDQNLVSYYMNKLFGKM